MKINYFLYILIYIYLAHIDIFASSLQKLREVSLKKDQLFKMVIFYDNHKKLFQMRWTLFVNDGLVVLRSYDKIVAQNVLYMQNANRSFLVKLMPMGDIFYNVPYLLVKFQAFKNNKAIFQLYLSDDRGQIGLKYLKNKN
ncbi:hypothetical protein MNB_SM-3-178 [hydrothermal vent metagenome]|uniref:Uncharacterized protein n=1 Tax=hydrothermal vent metagenome TaxID=652676 RepID=A0A1W1D2P4_9ZZZZ